MTSIIFHSKMCMSIFKVRRVSDIPGSARNLHVTATSPGRISVGWEAPSDTRSAHLTSYVLQYRLVNDSSYTSVKTDSADVLAYDLTG